MTVQLNVKGYVGWSEWWANTIVPLMSIAELSQLSTSEIETELNTDVTWYYNKFSQSGDLQSWTWNWVSYDYLAINWYFYKYNTRTLMWAMWVYEQYWPDIIIDD